MRYAVAALVICAATGMPQMSSACAQLAPDVWMCDRGTVWETAEWDIFGDGSTRYTPDFILNFTQEWPGFEITDSVATLEEQFATYAEWIAADGGSAPEVLQVDKIVTPRGLTLRHLQYDEVEGDRTMSAVMLSEVGAARIMVYLDAADTMPLEQMEKMSFDVAMMLRDTCADAIACAPDYEPPARGTD
jgi:hypothetical protein